MKKIIPFLLISLWVVACTSQEESADTQVKSELARAFEEGQTPMASVSLNAPSFPHLIGQEDYPANFKPLAQINQVFEQNSGDIAQLNTEILQLFKEIEGTSSDKVNKQMVALQMLDQYLLKRQEAADKDMLLFYTDILLQNSNPSWELQVAALDRIGQYAAEELPQRATLLKANMVAYKDQMALKLAQEDMPKTSKEYIEANLAKVDRLMAGLAVI